MKGTVLGFDFGLRRTGVASGELEIGVAHPLTTLKAASRAARFAAIDRLIEEWRPALLVVGMPLSADGSEHEMTRAARNFAAALEARYRLPVFMHDERYSSAVIEDDLRARHRDVAQSRHSVDALAAQLILQGFFDARATA